MPWGVEYLLLKPPATTMNPGRAASQEWPVRYYFCFDHTKCYYHYRSGLDASCTVCSIGPTHHTAPELYMFSIYILMRQPEATDAEMCFCFCFFSATTSYNSVGHFAEPSGWKWTTSLNVITTLSTAGALKVFSE